MNPRFEKAANSADTISENTVSVSNLRARTYSEVDHACDSAWSYEAEQEEIPLLVNRDFPLTDP